MYSREPYTLDRIFRLIITVAILAMAIWLINRLKDVLLPFCVASLIAYMFEPFVQFNRRLLHLKGRVVAIFVTLFETTFFIGLFLYFFIPMMAHEISDMGEMLQKYANSELRVPYIPAAVHRFIRHNIAFVNAPGSPLDSGESCGRLHIVCHQCGLMVHSSALCGLHHD